MKRRKRSSLSKFALKRYQQPPISPWNIFLTRLRTRDLSPNESAWVGVLLLTTLGICVFLISNLISLISKVSLAVMITVLSLIAVWLIAGLSIASWRGSKKMFAELLAKKTFSDQPIPSKIELAPGSKLLSIADFLYSAKTVEEVFKPIIADWRTEYFEALKQNRTIKARWISVRYRYHFGVAMGVSKVYSLFKSLLSARK